MGEREWVEIGRLDFSQAHFLDHSIWTCGRRPETQTGGRRRHLAYSWSLTWKPALKSRTLCKIGRHSAVRVWRGHMGKSASFMACANCAKRL